MPDYKIKCEVLEVSTESGRCQGAACMRKGQAFVLGARTPEPEGICARSFASLYPTATALRFSEETPWERGKGFMDVRCPDGQVVYRLSRLK